MNEAETRAEHIDPALKAAGWGVVEGSKILREYPITPGRIEGHGRRGKPLIADYVLVYRNRKLAVVDSHRAVFAGMVDADHGGDLFLALDVQQVDDRLAFGGAAGLGGARILSDHQACQYRFSGHRRHHLRDLQIDLLCDRFTL